MALGDHSQAFDQRLPKDRPSSEQEMALSVIEVPGQLLSGTHMGKNAHPYVPEFRAWRFGTRWFGHGGGPMPVLRFHGLLGEQKAVRAVAGACAANVLGVAIPCHRAIRSDGGLAGYRWGVARKRALLKKEAQE